MWVHSYRYNAGQPFKSESFNPPARVAIWFKASIVLEQSANRSQYAGPQNKFNYLDLVDD